MFSIETITALVLSYRYLIIVPLSWVVQPITGMVTGALARLGYFDLLILYIVLFSAAIAGDIFWYWVGYRWGERFVGRFGRYFSITPTHVEGAKRIFSRYHAPILLVSKVTNGVGLAWVTLFTAGLTRIPFGRYLVLNIVGEAVWSFMILFIGYSFSHLYLTVHDAMGKAFLIAATVLCVILVWGFWRYLRRRIAREFEEAA